jgi:hypothetical protein
MTTTALPTSRILIVEDEDDWSLLDEARSGG